MQEKLLQSIRYSEAFKRQVVNDLSMGKHANINAVCRAYEGLGWHTVARWIKLYGDTGFLPKKVVVMGMNEKDEVKQLRAKVRQLESALSDTTCQYLLEKAHLEVYCKDNGEDIEQVKKKLDVALSRKHQGKGKA